MAWCDPKLAVVDVGWNHLLVATFPVFMTDELHQSVVDVSSTRQEEAAARTQLMEKVKFLLLNNDDDAASKEIGHNNIIIMSQNTNRVLLFNWNKH